ncbi:hypothetical protein [Acidovorax sp. Q11]
MRSIARPFAKKVDVREHVSAQRVNGAALHQHAFKKQVDAALKIQTKIGSSALCISAKSYIFSSNLRPPHYLGKNSSQ